MFTKTVRSSVTGGFLGGMISVVVNNALIEISLTPFFAAVFGGILMMLGALMLWRKLWEHHSSSITRLLVLAFSALVFFSGVSCFLLEKDWFKRIPPKAKLPLYMALGVSLCFAVSFSVVDLINLYADRCARSPLPVVSSSAQIFLVLSGAVAMGATFGLIFGAMDVEDDISRLRSEERFSMPIGAALGAAVGAGNALLGQVAISGVSLLGEEGDALLGED